MSIRLATKLNALALYAIAGLLIAAFGWCPDNPVRYELIQGAA